jgi:hypothetical protein
VDEERTTPKFAARWPIRNAGAGGRRSRGAVRGTIRARSGRGSLLEIYREAAPERGALVDRAVHWLWLIGRTWRRPLAPPQEVQRMSLKIVTVVGARPSSSRPRPSAARPAPDLRGSARAHRQHYDDHMSKVFFDELDVPPPDCHLGIGSGATAPRPVPSRGARRSAGPRKAGPRAGLRRHESTLAGALAAAKLHLPVAHMEAACAASTAACPRKSTAC